MAPSLPTSTCRPSRPDPGADRGLQPRHAPDKKVNLGVGVYFTEDGKIPVLRAVAEAERRRAAAALGARLPADRRHPGL